MIRLDVREVKTRLSKCLAKVENGETILLCRDDQPIAEIRPITGQT
jgi:antitoxin (DNA-binding transcriptional repressor) of toxin-antitoxin stability system